MTRHAGDIDCSYNAQHATEQVFCSFKTAAIDPSCAYAMHHLFDFFFNRASMVYFPNSVYQLILR